MPYKSILDWEKNEAKFTPELTESSLKIKVLSETRRLIPKVLKNQMVTKLMITGPWTLNVNLVLENLQELKVKMPTGIEVDGDCFSFY